MSDDYRHFTVGPDPFGRTWLVQFRWHQTAISIRHADAVDAKFQVSTEGESEEKIVSIPHPELLRLSRETGQPVTDPWVLRLAALHLKHVLLTGEDLEKTLITVSPEDLRRHHGAVQADATAARR